MHSVSSPSSPSSAAHFGALVTVLFLCVAAPRSQHLHPTLPAPAGLCDALDVQQATTQQLQITPGPSRREVAVRLDGTSQRLLLEPHDMRAPGFRMLVDDGEGLHAVPTPPSVTYRGRVAGHTDSVVAASIVGGQLRATLWLDGALWGVQPLADALRGVPTSGLHLVFRGRDLTPSPFVCGVQDHHGAAPAPARVSAPQPPAPPPPPAALDIAEIAIDADEPFYRAMGSSTTGVQNDITTVLNTIDVIYQRDVGITHTITTIIVRTQPLYSSTSSSALLGEFRNHWNQNHTGITRDIAHLFTGRSRSSSVIGIATLSSICSATSGYGLSWSLYSRNLTNRVGLTAHELGHNWSAGHCDGSNPCWIMCSGLGGCSGNLTMFAPTVISQILRFKSRLPCLSTNGPAPILTAVTPSTFASFRILPTPPVVVTASNLDNVISVTLAGQVVAFTKTSLTTLDLSVPIPFAIGTHSVIVTNRAGISNPFPVTITGNHPSVVAPRTLVLAGHTVPLDVHTGAGWHAWLLASTSNTPSTLPGLVNLGLGNAFAQLHFVGTLPADPRGMARFYVAFPAGLPRIPLFWQAVTFDPAALVTPLEVSNVETTLVY